jgi:hypothetical protein
MRCPSLLNKYSLMPARGDAHREETNVYETYVGSEIGKLRTERAEQQAARNWRFREIKTPAAKAATALLTSVLSFLIR